MKVFGIILAAVGNVLTILFGITTILFGVLSSFMLVSYVLPIVFSAITIVSFVLAKIGNKIDDKQLVDGPLMKAKRAILGIAKIIFVNPFSIIVFCLAFFGLVGIGIINLVSAETYFGIGGIEAIIGGVSIVVVVSFLESLLVGYVERHCKYCGGSFSGAAWQYEEEEREFKNTSDGKTQMRSKIRFEFTCPCCGEETIYRKKMMTNAEAVEKYVRSITK